MFAALLAFVLVTAYAADELPSYIHVCGRKDTTANYDQCLVDNINIIKSKLCTGIPEFNVDPIEPVTINKIVIFDIENLKLFIRDSMVRGVCNFDVTSHTVSPDKLYFEFEFLIKHLTMDSVYDFDIHLLVSLAHKGFVHISLDNLDGKLSLHLKEVTKNGKKQIYASKINAFFNIKKFNYEFDNSEKDLVQLHEVIRNIVDENEKNIVSKVKPKLEEILSKLLISVFNNVTYNRYEQLFPDEA